MKKLIPLLILCFAVLCFFSSCGMFETIPVEGTWTSDFTEEVGYNKTAYYTFKLVFSGEKVQIIKERYELSGHRNLISSDVMEAFSYKTEKDGVFTASHIAGIFNMTEIKETFTMDKNNKLIWKQGCPGGKQYTFTKENSATAFSPPSSANDTYEQYNLQDFGEEAYIKYYNTSLSGVVRADRPNLTLYADGRYVIDLINSGTWEKSKDDPNKITLTSTSDPNNVFSKMELSYDANWLMLEISDTETTNANYEDKGYFKFTYSWYRSFYLYF